MNKQPNWHFLNNGYVLLTHPEPCLSQIVAGMKNRVKMVLCWWRILAEFSQGKEKSIWISSLLGRERISRVPRKRKMSIFLVGWSQAASQTKFPHEIKSGLVLSQRLRTHRIKFSTPQDFGFNISTEWSWAFQWEMALLSRLSCHWIGKIVLDFLFGRSGYFLHSFVRKTNILSWNLSVVIHLEHCVKEAYLHGLSVYWTGDWVSASSVIWYEAGHKQCADTSANVWNNTPNHSYVSPSDAAKWPPCLCPIPNTWCMEAVNRRWNVLLSRVLSITLDNWLGKASRPETGMRI